MKTLINTSHDRTITHDDNGQVYRIEGNQVRELPDDVADAILSGWKQAKIVGGEKASAPVVPWEHSAGPTWDRAKLEFPHIGKVQQTEGPSRPEVVEPLQPEDAYDERGNLIPSKANNYPCPQDGCGKVFDKLKGVRMHQRVTHGT